MKLGESELGLSQAESGEPIGARQRISIWIYADDRVAAVDRLRAAGARVVEEPTLQPWGETVARVLDPDGNELIIGSVET